MSTPRKARPGRIRTAVTAAAIIGAGVLTGTLLALSPLFDETSHFAAPTFRPHTTLQTTSTYLPFAPAASLQHHQPRAHFLHGVHTAETPQPGPTASL